MSVKIKSLTALLIIISILFTLEPALIPQRQVFALDTISYELDSNNQDSQEIYYSLDDKTKTANVIQSDVSGDILVPEKVVKNNQEYTVTSLGDEAFRSNYKITSVSLPNTIKSIGTLAFFGCEKLTKITLPESLTTISDSVFRGCSFSEITIPKNVSSIGYLAFYNNSKLTQINVVKENKYFASVNGVLFNNKLTTLIYYPYAKTDTSYTIPSSVKEIESYAFFYCNNLKSITIPNGVEIISSNAFAGCQSIKSISISDSVTNILPWAFSDCTNLKKVRLSNNMNYIENHTFANCEGLEEIKIPEKIDYISNNAFSNCSSLKRILILNKSLNFADTINADNKTDALKLINNSSDESAGTYKYSGVISGYKNSTSKNYADLTGYTFKEFILGDVNADGLVNSSDAVEILKFYANSIVGKSADIDEFSADVNFDDSIDSTDAVKILKYYADFIINPNIDPMEEVG